jgi:hypothetical protein
MPAQLIRLADKRSSLKSAEVWARVDSARPTDLDRRFKTSTTKFERTTPHQIFKGFPLNTSASAPKIHDRL